MYIFIYICIYVINMIYYLKRLYRGQGFKEALRWTMEHSYNILYICMYLYMYICIYIYIYIYIYICIYIFIYIFIYIRIYVINMIYYLKKLYRGQGFKEALRWTMEHSMDDGEGGEMFIYV
jgi:hypothetical protein